MGSEAAGSRGRGSTPATFWDTPGNPVPSGAELSSVRTADGVFLRVATWSASAAPDSPGRGTVLLLQGRAEFIEKYFETVGELRARGYRVVAFDWRGQGGSDRLLRDRHRGHVRHFDDFRRDCEAVMREAVPGGPEPLVVLAHSMGGCIAMTGALEGWLRADRLVVLSPMVGLSIVKRTRLVRWLARLLSRLGFGRFIVPGGQRRSISTLPFAGNRLAADQARYDRNAAVAAALDWGAIGSPTVGWLRAAFEAMDRLAAPGAAAGIAVPTLILAAGDDPVCSTPAIQLFSRDLCRGRIAVIPGSRHEILMETDAIRDVFWAEFDDFVAGGTDPDLVRAPAAVSA